MIRLRYSWYRIKKKNCCAIIPIILFCGSLTSFAFLFLLSLAQEPQSVIHSNQAESSRTVGERTPGALQDPSGPGQLLKLLSPLPSHWDHYKNNLRKSSALRRDLNAMSISISHGAVVCSSDKDGQKILNLNAQQVRNNRGFCAWIKTKEVVDIKIFKLLCYWIQ